jgi:Domain of unknown function (DUF6434)
MLHYHINAILSRKICDISNIRLWPARNANSRIGRVLWLKMTFQKSHDRIARIKKPCACKPTVLMVAMAQVSSFDWHGGQITRATPITKSYRNTQTVRRFFEAECGNNVKFDRAFMAWLKDGTEKTMGEAADEWLRREAAKWMIPISPDFGMDRVCL